MNRAMKRERLRRVRRASIACDGQASRFRITRSRRDNVSGWSNDCVTRGAMAKAQTPCGGNVFLSGSLDGVADSWWRRAADDLQSPHASQILLQQIYWRSSTYQH